jgi:hypothetical protein
VRSVGGLGLDVTVDPTGPFARMSGTVEKWQAVLDTASGPGVPDWATLLATLPPPA